MIGEDVVFGSICPTGTVCQNVQYWGDLNEYGGVDDGGPGPTSSSTVCDDTYITTSINTNYNYIWAKCVQAI